MMKVDAYRLRSKLLPLLRRFEAAQHSDKQAERAAKKTGAIAGVSFVAAFISLFFALPATDSDIYWPLLVTAGLIVTAIVSLWRFFVHRRYDLEDRKLLAVVRVLRMLRTDTPQEAVVELAVDFRDYQEGGETVEQAKEGGTKRFKYSHPWYRLGGALADGTRYQLSVTDTVGRKERSKRKYTKVKERIRSTVDLQLRLRPEKYGNAQDVAGLLRTIPAPRPLRVVDVKAQGQRLAARLAMPEVTRVRLRHGVQESGQENVVTADTLLQTLLWAYDGIGRSLAKPA